jgi:hypothetical protein
MYLTHRAQINAMPCLPDKFTILVTRLDHLSARDGITIPMFRGYSVDEIGSFTGETKLIYIRRESPLKPVDVQQILLDSFHYEGTS